MIEERATPEIPLPSAMQERRRRGFTLIEIMAVVVIMGMLMATLAVGIAGQLEKASITNARGQIARIEQALDFYKLDNKRYPNSDQGLDALVNKRTAAPVPRNWTPPGYVKSGEVLVDPWDQPFQYRQPGEHNPYTFDIWSYGPDGVEGGDDDITNWTSQSDA